MERIFITFFISWQLNIYKNERQDGYYILISTCPPGVCSSRLSPVQTTGQALAGAGESLLTVSWCWCLVSTPHTPPTTFTPARDMFSFLSSVFKVQYNQTSLLFQNMRIKWISRFHGVPVYVVVPQIDPSVPQLVVQSRRRPLLGPSPGWKRLLGLSHLRHYAKRALTLR